jgi:NTP pyrophosphatase (non-canonical NTP hydrolase)
MSMTPEEYRVAALRTEHTPRFINHACRNIEAIDTNAEQYDRARKHDQRLSRMMHAVLGMITELGELCDPLKKHLIYGATLDTKNLAEEIGDQAWYSNLFIDALEVRLASIWERNIAKLRARFPDKFTEEKALNRDLDAEKRALEGNDHQQEIRDRADWTNLDGDKTNNTPREEYLPLPAGRALEAIRERLDQDFAPTSKYPDAIVAAVDNLLKGYADRGRMLDEQTKVSTEALKELNGLRAKIKNFALSNGA